MRITKPNRAAAAGLAVVLISTACSNAGTTDPKQDCAVNNDTYCHAAAGDLLDLALGDLHPTQPSLGYDEVFSRVGRYTLSAPGSPSPALDAWCAANGQKALRSAGPGAKVSDPASFTCEVPLGAETDDTTAGMKTAVIGPGGQVYLTDGHHTLTSFWETPGGGPATHIRVRVTDNLKDLAPAAFWARMESEGWAWLRDANGDKITPDRLPTNLGLKNFANDKYRGALFFLRDVSYFQDDSIPAFQEFYWGHWLRAQTDPGLRPENFDLSDVNSYLALLGNIGTAMVALPDDTALDAGRTAKELGKLPAFGQKAFDALPTPLDSPKPGKLAFAVAYKKGH